LACGQPYVLAAGAITVTSEIKLTPAASTNPVGTAHTVTATVALSGLPLGGTTVHFIVSAGPNAGITGSCVTNAAGQCTFTYVGSGGVGTDTILGSFTVAGSTQSATAQKTWTAAAAQHSLGLNGSTAFAEAPDAPKLHMAGDYTVEVWFKD